MQIDPPAGTTRSNRTPVGGRAWLYVLVAQGGEDLLKVGLTHDPLARWSAFHPRWFEAFDLPFSLLVACETRRDAQSLETTLHRQLADHRCPMPLSMRLAAAGATEWYRGAYPRALEYVAACEAAGHVVQRDARSVIGPLMQRQAERIDGLLRLAHAQWLEGRLGDARRHAVIDCIDAHRHFDPDLEARLPREAWDALTRGRP